MHTGHCHCKAASYAFDGAPLKATFCHCSLCRRITGSAFAPWCEVPAADLRWSGRETLERYALTGRLAILFCRECGAPLVATHTKWPETAFLLMGALEGDAGITPEYHIFAGSKAPWHEITDSLPQYERWREDAS